MPLGDRKEIFVDLEAAHKRATRTTSSRCYPTEIDGIWFDSAQTPQLTSTLTKSVGFLPWRTGRKTQIRCYNLEEDPEKRPSAYRSLFDPDQSDGVSFELYSIPSCEDEDLSAAMMNLKYRRFIAVIPCAIFVIILLRGVVHSRK